MQDENVLLFPCLTEIAYCEVKPLLQTDKCCHQQMYFQEKRLRLTHKSVSYLPHEVDASNISTFLISAQKPQTSNKELVDERLTRMRNNGSKCPSVSASQLVGGQEMSFTPKFSIISTQPSSSSYNSSAGGFEYGTLNAPSNSILLSNHVCIL
jgi:hypothetical protein